MFSAFWFDAYVRLFEGAKTLTPLVHPSVDLSIFPIVGRIISHGYLACGYLPVKITLPSFITMVLGPTVAIPSSIIIESFTDYLSHVERLTLKAALENPDPFSPSVTSELTNVLSRCGCQMIPTRANVHKLVEQAARYEFCTKPAAALALIYSGVPLNHKDFWQKKSASDIHALFYKLTVTPSKVLDSYD